MNKSKTVVKSVGFLSFFKLTLLYGVAIGQVCGLVMLIAAICGAAIGLDLFGWKTEGYWPGLAV